MKKIIIAAVVLAVTGLASLTVSSKSTTAKHIDVVKIDKDVFAAKQGGFGTPKNDMGTAD